MTKKLYLHIGTHKTGSTSIQHFLLDHAGLLRNNGIALYAGQYRETNHIELYLASLRYGIDSFAKQRLGNSVSFDPDFTYRVSRRVQHFLRSCAEPRVVFSCEGLSLLRHDDEIDRLKSVLGDAHADATIILYLRDKADFLRSYTRQALKHGRKPSRDRQSALYIEPDTWLTDYDALIGAYERGFGPSNVAVIDYDAEMRREGNIIPSFLRVLQIEAPRGVDIDSYFLKKTNLEESRRPRQPWVQRLKDLLRAG